MRSGASALPFSFFEWQEAPSADFAVIGDPVSHSLSPIMHTAAYEALSLSYRYVAVRVPASEVAKALNRLLDLGYRGANVTVPDKEAALDWCLDADAFSKKVRAANTISLNDRKGINTDGPGFLDTLRDANVPAGRALLIGAGGSARSIALALAESGWTLGIANRTPSRAEELILSLGIDAELIAKPAAASYDLIVNGTSASLRGESLDIDWSGAKPNALAYDLMYSAKDTPFIHDAKIAGLRTMDGLNLLVAQGARSFNWWMGFEAPTMAMMEAVRCN